MSAKKRLSTEQRRALLASPAGWLACGFGSGLAPVAQGTFGSLAALLPWWLLRELPWWIYLAVLLVGFAIGVRACAIAGAGSRAASRQRLPVVDARRRLCPVPPIRRVETVADPLVRPTGEGWPGCDDRRCDRRRVRGRGAGAGTAGAALKRRRQG